MLYQGLTGELPFAGRPLDILAQKRTRVPPPPRELALGVPSDLGRLALDLLAIDPGKRPGGLEILRLLGSPGEAALPPTASAASPLFIGRGRERAALREAFEESCRGVPVTVLVEGESGVGKSGLAARFAREVIELDPRAVVLAGRCYERESVPFKAFDGVVDSLARYMTRLPAEEASALLPRQASLVSRAFPVLRRVRAFALLAAPAAPLELDPQERRTRLFAAMRELFARLAERRPVVVVVDDIQWIDQDSIALGREVVVRLRLKLRGLRYSLRKESDIPPRKLRQIDLFWHIGLALAMVERTWSTYFHSLGLLRALQAGEPRRLTRALAIEASAFQAQRGDRARPEMERALAAAARLVELAPDPHAVAMIALARAGFAYVAGHFRAAVPLCEEAERLFREGSRGAPYEIATMRLFTLRSLLFTGELPELKRRVRQAIREFEERGDLYGATTVTAAVLPHVTLAAGQPERARAQAAEAIRRWSPSGFHVQHFYALAADASARLYRGDASTIEEIAAAWPALRRSLIIHLFQIVRVQMLDLRARAALLAARERPAERGARLAAAAIDARRLGRERAAWVRPIALLVESQVARARGEAQARVLLRRAAEGFDAVEMELHAAVTRARRGALLGGGEGEAMAAAARAWMERQEIASPTG